MTSTDEPDRLDKGASNCEYPEGHEQHMAINGDCPWCGSYDKSKWLPKQPERKHDVMTCVFCNGVEKHDRDCTKPELLIHVIDAVIDGLVAADEEDSSVMDDDLNKWGIQFVYNAGAEIGDKASEMTLDEAVEYFQKYALTDQQFEWIKTYLEEAYGRPYWA